jgi:hypothetical protein
MPYAKPTHPSASPDAPIKFEAEPFHYAVPNQELLDDIAAVAVRLKAATIFAQQYQKHGRFSTQTIRDRFGDWNHALVAAKLQPSAPQLVDDDAMLRDLARVAEKLGTPDLARNDYQREGNYSITNIARRFGTWSRAKHAAGLITKPPRVPDPTDVDLFGNFENVWRSLHRQPRGGDFVLPQSRFALGAYYRRFGTFRNALAAFLAHQHQTGKTTAMPLLEEMVPPHRTRRGVGPRLRYQILVRDHFRCRICGRSPASDPAVQLHIDHIKPWSSGGETTPDNLQTLCETCNAGKGDSQL